MIQQFAVFVLAAATVMPVRAQHPESIRAQEIVSLDLWGQIWFSASRVLEPDGSISPSGVAGFHSRDLQGMNRWFGENFGSAREHGLTEGSVPPRKFCPPITKIYSPPIWNKAEDVHGSLLLSDVAVSAKVAAVEPGFRATGAPVLRLSLSDVELLHGRSALPEYVLVPVGRLVIRDRVYCGDAEQVRGTPPAIGDRLVVIGEWGSSGTVNIGHIGFSSLAAVEGTALKWAKGRRGPETLDQLRELIRESEAEGLFALTSHLFQMPYGTEGKHLFSVEWMQLRMPALRRSPRARRKRLLSGGCTPRQWRGPPSGPR